MIIQHRRGDTSDWKKADSLAKQLPDVVLKDGELAIEELTDGSRRIRIGDGSSKFFDLPYVDTAAVAIAEELIANAVADLQKNIINSSTEQITLVENTKKLLLGNLAEQIATVTDSYKAADSLMATELNNKISDLVITQDKLATDAEAEELAIAAISTRLTSTDSKLTGHITASTSQLQKVSSDIVSISSNLENSTKELNAKLDTYRTDVTKELGDVATKLEEQFVADIDTTETKLEKAISSNAVAHASNLQAVRSYLENLLITNKDTHEKNINELKATLEAADIVLSSNIDLIDKRDSTAINEILAELDSLKTDIQQLGRADSSLISQIYEVDNTLTDITNRLATELSTLTDNHETAVVNLTEDINSIKYSQRTSDALIVDKMLEYISDIYSELADLVDDDILILEKVFSIENALTSRIRSIEADLSTTITRLDDLSPDLLADVKASLIDLIVVTESNLTSHITNVETATTDRFDNIENVELPAFKHELEGRINSVEQSLSTNIIATEAALNSKIAEVEDNLAIGLNETKNFLTSEISNTKDIITADITTVNNKLDMATAATETLSKALISTEERLSNTDSELTTRLTTAEESFVNKINYIEDLLESEIETINSSIDTKISELQATDPEATEITDTCFINTIKQENGKIFATKAQLPIAGNSVAGITTLGVPGGAASYSQVKENADEIAEIKSAIAGGVHFIAVTTSNLFDGSTVNPIIIDNVDYIATTGDIVLYSEKEFIWTGSTWKELGDLSRVGILEAWRTDLNTLDTLAASQFVTAVYQTDGKIDVARAQPTAADIEYHGDSLSAELANRANAFADLLTRCLQLNARNNTFYVGEDTDNSIILYCGNARDI